MQCSAVECSTAQYSTVQYSTVQYSTVQDPVLHLVEDAHAPGEAHGVHVVEAEVKQALGSSGDTVALAANIKAYFRYYLPKMPLALYEEQKCRGM